MQPDPTICTEYRDETSGDVIREYTSPRQKVNDQTTSSSVEEVLTKGEIISGLDAIIGQTYNAWRKNFPPDKRFPDYEILLAIRKMLDS